MSSVSNLPEFDLCRTRHGVDVFIIHFLISCCPLVPNMPTLVNSSGDGSVLFPAKEWEVWEPVVPLEAKRSPHFPPSHAMAVW